MQTVNVELLKNNETIFKGHPADVKEKVQDMFLEKYGFYPDFQESDLEDGDEEYYIYLHTDNYDELEEDQLTLLDELEVTEDPEDTTEALKKLFDIDFKICS